MPRLLSWVVETRTKKPFRRGRFALQGEAIIMKRKPDILWVLVLIFGLGVVTTGYTQSLWERQAEPGGAPVLQTTTQAQR